MIETDLTISVENGAVLERASLTIKAYLRSQRVHFNGPECGKKTRTFRIRNFDRLDEIQKLIQEAYPAIIFRIGGRIRGPYEGFHDKKLFNDIEKQELARMQTERLREERIPLIP